VIDKLRRFCGQHFDGLGWESRFNLMSKESLPIFGSQRSDLSRPDEVEWEVAQIHWRLSTRGPVWRPPTDLFETEDELVLRVEIAGMREQDFSIQLDERSLVVRGVRSEAAEKRAFHQMEIRFGEFSLEIELPAAVDAEKVRAYYDNGFLRISLPKAQTHHIPVSE